MILITPALPIGYTIPKFIFFKINLTWTTVQLFDEYYLNSSLKALKYLTENGLKCLSVPVKCYLDKL